MHSQNSGMQWHVWTDANQARFGIMKQSIQGHELIGRMLTGGPELS